MILKFLVIVIITARVVILYKKTKEINLKLVCKGLWLVLSLYGISDYVLDLLTELFKQLQHFVIG